MFKDLKLYKELSGFSKGKEYEVERSISNVYLIRNDKGEPVLFECISPKLYKNIFNLYGIFKKKGLPYVYDYFYSETRTKQLRKLAGLD